MNRLHLFYRVLVKLFNSIMPCTKQNNISLKRTSLISETALQKIGLIGDAPDSWIDLSAYIRDIFFYKQIWLPYAIKPKVAVINLIF
ncbi:MAG: hypothetical protein Q8934_10800 [Bacillota bacterium]|nr:hypothetical protein [Bacillota bacterium]